MCATIDELADQALYDFRLRRDDRVAEGMLSVHPAGKPMNHSSHRGFS
jgi:hypothetical protein